MRIKEWIDVSMDIKPDMMVYKNYEVKKPVFTVRAAHETHGHYEGSIYMDLHTGTHIDMPLHMIKVGVNSDDFDLDLVNGKCVLADLSNRVSREIIREDLLDYEISSGDIVILKTQNSFEEVFNVEYTYLTESGARYLMEKEVKAVGIDALGIERSQEGHPTHHILLGAGIAIIEGLRLSGVKDGHYELLCLPLKIMGVEGLPARALLKPWEKK